MPVDMTINLSSVIAGAVALGGMAVGWGALRSDLNTHRKEMEEVRERHRDQDAATQVKLDKLEHRIRNTEQSQTAVVTKIEGMLEMLREVRDAVLRRNP